MVELSIQTVVLIVLAMIILLVVIGLAMLVRERGLEAVGDILNIEKWIEMISERLREVWGG
jgi:hypothetical protein